MAFKEHPVVPPKWPLSQGEDHMVLARLYVLHQNEKLLQTANNALRSHMRRVGFGLSGTLSELEVSELNLYIARLNAVPQQTGFPYNVEWPRTPDCLRKQIID